MDTTVQCPVCQQEMTKRGLVGHIRTHETEKLRQRVKELEAQLGDVANKVPAKPVAGPIDRPAPSPTPAPAAELQDIPESAKIAILGDWLEGMTKEAWVRIGEEAGYFDVMDGEPAAAPVLQDAAPADVQPGRPAEAKTVVLPGGLIVKVGAAK